MHCSEYERLEDTVERQCSEYEVGRQDRCIVVNMRGWKTQDRGNVVNIR